MNIKLKSRDNQAVNGSRRCRGFLNHRFLAAAPLPLLFADIRGGSVTLSEAMTQLRAWCDRSQGEEIEIVPGITGAFQSRGIFTEDAVRLIERELRCNLPSAYYEFMATIGESSLFGGSPSGGHWFFYNPHQVIEVSQQWATAQPEVERFCFVGEHRCMGDMMGFCIDRSGPTNFDIYCHEYPFEEYVAISDEIKSWREFGPYVAGVVSRFGQDSL